MTDKKEWKWFGVAGHFICAHYCRFHMCTQVGEYLISTVGEYIPPEAVREITATSRGVKLEGKGDAREADYLNKVGYEPLGAWMEGWGEKPIYETMVFRAGKPCDRPDCMCGLPAIDGSELDTRRCGVRGTAQSNHMELCEEYAKL